MIVSLDELKTVLGIPLNDASQDPYLTRLILAKTVWIEGYTQRRFDAPIPHVQIEQGTGESEIYLEWHVDDTVQTPPVPAPVVIVSRRPMLERFRPWEVLVEGDDWERNGDVLYFLRAWQVWPIEDEIKVEYPGGYYSAPEDIKEVVLSLASNQYLLDTVTTTGTAGITSEKIGDFSYNVDLGASTNAAGSDVVSGTGLMTLNRYKRRFA